MGPFKLVTVEETKVLWPLTIRWCNVPNRVCCYVSGCASLDLQVIPSRLKALPATEVFPSHGSVIVTLDGSYLCSVGLFAGLYVVHR